MKVRLLKEVGEFSVGQIFEAEKGTFMGAKVWRLHTSDGKLLGIGKDSAEEVVEVNGVHISIAESLVNDLRAQYDLTYRCAVNLEGTINNMLFYGLKLHQIKDVIEDLYDNFEGEDREG